MKSTYAVLAWHEPNQAWELVEGGFTTYREATRFAVQYETPSMPACVRREPVVFPAAAQVAA